MFLMSDSEVFLEVDEDYRRERMIAFWKRYGTAFLAAAVVVPDRAKLFVVPLASATGWRAPGAPLQQAQDRL